MQRPNVPTYGVVNVAKDKKAVVPPAPTPEKQRVTGYLDPISHACFTAMCDLWSATSGDGIERLVWNAFSALETREKEAVSTMVRVKTGRSCRPTNAKPTKSVADDIEQGSGNSETDGALARTNRIVDLQTRMVNAADVAIDSLAN